MADTRSDGDRTRQRILDAALPLFAEHGYAGTSVRTVAAAAGVNVATLAYHFADKAGLYATVVQRLHEDLAAAFPTPSPAASPEAAVRSWVAAGWSFAVAHRPHLRLLLRHVLDHGAQPDVVMEQWSDALLDRGAALLALVRPDWPAPRRRLLLLSLQHLTVRLVLEDPVQLAHMSGLPEDRVPDDVVAWLGDMAVRLLELR